jgi:Porin subfamily
MRNTLSAIVVAMLPASLAAAGHAGASKPATLANPGRLLPPRGAGASHSCAAYGPGFVNVDGTETCIRIGGTVRIEAGRSIGDQ